MSTIKSSGVMNKIDIFDKNDWKDIMPVQSNSLLLQKCKEPIRLLVCFLKGNILAAKSFDKYDMYTYTCVY